MNGYSQVEDVFQIPWGHHKVIMDKVKGDFIPFTKQKIDLFCFSSVLSCINAEKIWCLRVFIVLLYAVRQVGLAVYVCTTESL